MAASVKSESTENKHFYYTNVDVSEYQSRMDKVRNKKESFGSQEIDVNDYILSPAGWEGLMFTLYALLIPYTAGILFLFVFVAHVAIEKFLLLDIASMFIVWAIGYEVLAISLLIGIFLSYLAYLKKSKNKEVEQRF